MPTWTPASYPTSSASSLEPARQTSHFRRLPACARRSSSRPSSSGPASTSTARPPIWRRLDLRSDISLLDAHRALQAAFGWLDYHLYRSSLGGSPFHPRSELFLCPYDVEEGEDPGTPVADVRLDETLHEPGDVLRYVYDYGDSWELTLRVESVHDASDATPAAWCVGGRRAAPPEDCGGLTDAESLSTVLDEPTHFHIDEVNAVFSNPIAQLLDAGIHARLAELLYRLESGRHSADLVARAARLLTPPTPVTTDQLDAELLPISGSYSVPASMATSPPRRLPETA